MKIEINNPTKVIIGDSIINELNDEILSLKSIKKILIVSNHELKVHVENTKNVIDQNKFDVEIFYIEDKEPSTEYIDSVSFSFKKENIDLLIGLGGGSAMDMAKAMAIALKNNEPIWNYANLSNRPPSKIEFKPLPVIAIPTTSGTGSEVTPYSVLTKLDTFQKGTIQQAEIIPKIAFIDPSFLVTMPSAITSYTGLDAFAHSFEAYINVSKLSPYCELVGLKAINLIFDNLYNAVNQPDIIEYRKNMALASSLSGIAISHRGTTAGHAIAEPLGALTKLPHAVSVSLATLPVIKATHFKENKILDAFIKNLNRDDIISSDDFISFYEDLIKLIDCDKPLKSFVKTESNFEDELISNVYKYKFRPLEQHPVQFDDKEFKKIIRGVIDDKK